MHSKPRSKLYSRIGILLLVGTFFNPWTAAITSAATIKQGASCKTQLEGKVVSVGNSKYKCTKSSTGKLIWIRQVISPKVVVKPNMKPGLTLEIQDDKLAAKVSIASKAVALENNCQVVKVLFKQPNSAGMFVTFASSSDVVANAPYTTNLIWTFTIKSASYAGKTVGVEALCLNDLTSGDSAEASIAIPSVALSPTPSASPTPEPSSDSVNLANAKRSAASYLRSSAFSKISLIKQLIYEGFSKADAELAVEAQNVDWNAQAAKSAAAYLKFSSFSYSGLLRQLEYEGFTNSQAVFGVSSTGLTATNNSPTADAPSSTSPTAAPASGCTVDYLSALPYANQKIAISSIAWDRDGQGYVTATLTMRNDNTMALRLVNFVFQFLYKSSIIKTTSTLEGDHHFFIQDDPKFNSLNGPSGPWNPGQVRTFKIPTNQILDCSSIQVTSSGFFVKQGIGAS